MPANSFDELLREFQAAYAKYGGELFFLTAVTREEWNEHRENIDRMTGCLGFVPLGEGNPGEVPGYYIFGPLYRNRWGRWTERWEEPFDCFKELAAKAGAFLPLAIREQIPHSPADPVGWWLAYMWWQEPPSEEDLLPPDGKTRNARVVWAEPFLEAAEAIEHGGLHTHEEGTSSVDNETGGKPDTPTDRGVPSAPEWSAPMTKAEMARRMTGKANARSREVEDLLRRFGLDHVAGLKWRVRLDTMDPATRRKIERPS